MAVNNLFFLINRTFIVIFCHNRLVIVIYAISYILDIRKYQFIN